MDHYCAKSISDHVNTNFGWKRDKSVFSLGFDGGNQVEFDVVPYLGRQGRKVLKATRTSAREGRKGLNTTLLLPHKEHLSYCIV